MLDWMKRLFRKEEQEDSSEALETETSPVIKEYEPLQKEVEVKVAYQYPQGKFRFPMDLREDVEGEEKEWEHSPLPIQEPEQQPEHMSRRQLRRGKIEAAATSEQAIPTRTNLPESNRRPFRPTEIASPVFGYERPDYNRIKRQQSTEDIELSVQTPSVVDAWLEKNGYIDPKQEQTIAVEELIEQLQPYQDEGNGAEHESYIERTEMERPALVEPVELLPQATKEIEAPVRQLEISETKEECEDEVRKEIDAKESIPAIELATAVERPVQQKPRVPYNVMMLQQDKRRLAHKLDGVGRYQLPPIHLLDVPPHMETNDGAWLQEQKELLQTTLLNFNVGARVVHITQGPSVTRFEVQPEPGVKVNKITNLADDIKLNLAARDIRIEAPIPGKNAVGIEVPNQKSKPVFLREILRSPMFARSESPLTVALGLDISGTPVITDLRKMPHGLIAGATGSGKSVCMNAILTSILYKAMPHEVKLLLIDPKMVELAPYNDVPHLLSPVITDAKAATAALKWAVEEMDRRYESFAHAGARDITRYNELVRQQQTPGQSLPYIVIVIDELADLMMVAPGDVEEAICRIAQKARACGIHLLVATQRPSVDVITGLIKSNIPTRIAFTVSSQVDSRTIIDTGGAEKLLGRGDMLFLENGTSKAVRLQGVYVSDEEIDRTVQHVKSQQKPSYAFGQEDLLSRVEQQGAEDPLFYEACQFVLEQNGASASSVQRRFRIGYNRASRLIDEMEEKGFISEARGTKPRDILITEAELAVLLERDAQR